MMPFDRYLQPDPAQDQQHASQAYYDNRLYHNMLGVDSSTFSGSVQFQMPQFMLGGPPTLVHGGGAEVLPPGLIGGSLTSSWLSNNGFYVDPQSFPSSSKFFNSSHSPSPHDYQQDHRPSSAIPPFDPYASLIAPSKSSSPVSPATPPSGSPPASALPFGQATHPIINASSLRLPLSAEALSAFNPTLHLSAPSHLGLPVYSTSGFDLLSILARVANRPNPKIVLGPVDMTCAFTVVDVRRYDNPIVYASPTFCQLTGYDEREVIGRNCRFLQAPDGRIQKGEPRRFTSPEAVGHLRKSLSAEKECQASLLNYRKGGQAFINLVTVIPVVGGVHGGPDEADEVVYYVGFQVDLTEQPNAILQKLRDGSYMVNYSASTIIPPPAGTSSRRTGGLSTHAVSHDLRSLLARPSFTHSLPLSTTANAVSTASNMIEPSPDAPHPLNLVLLESSPDFVHVLSLKGSFLYVAPSIRRILGYQPEELIGKSISDYCHPADVVPLMRELKESSTPASSDGQMVPPAPKPVDLLFRIQSKAKGYLWVECRGRLHVEPGKGRKAIILSGRVRDVPRLSWSSVYKTGGLTQSEPIRYRQPESNGHEVGEEQVLPTRREKEFWGLMSNTGTFLVVGSGVRDVLGWGAGEVIGRTVGSFVTPDMREILEGTLRATSERSTEPRIVPCQLSTKESGLVNVRVVLYQADNVSSPFDLSTLATSSSQCPIVCQIKIAEDPSSPRPRSPYTVHSPTENIFEELETTRGSSWQYELQQLKFSNQRLSEDVDNLEAELASSPAGAPFLPGAFHPHANPRARSASHNATDSEQEWRLQREGRHSSHSGHLKRPWSSLGDVPRR